MIASFFASLLLSAQAEPAPFLTFTRSATGLPLTQVEIGTLRSEEGRHYWFRQVRLDNGEQEISWTDTQQCEGALAVVENAAGIEAPEIHVPGIPVTPDGSITLTLDGVQYSFESGAHYAGNISSRISFTSNTGTPLADYVEASLTALEDCWTDSPPGAFYPSPE